MPAMPDAKSGVQIVFDTSVLSNFAVCGQVHLLEHLYKGGAYTTLMVVDEIERGIDAGYEYLGCIKAILAPVQTTGWLNVLSLESADEQRLYIELYSYVDAGEASCLAVAISQGFSLATDDLAARRVAKDRRVKLTGTVGVLLRLVRENLLPLDEANKILEQMIALRFRSPVDRLDDLV